MVLINCLSTPTRFDFQNMKGLLVLALLGVCIVGLQGEDRTSSQKKSRLEADIENNEFAEFEEFEVDGDVPDDPKVNSYVETEVEEEENYDPEEDAIVEVRLDGVASAVSLQAIWILFNCNRFRLKP